MADIIQLRRDTAANWTSTNPILALGELGVETDTGFGKVGDGVTGWTGLGYNFVGPAGPQGEQGIQGPQGEQGIPGEDGADGPSDHTLLTNIGVNTHAQIDTHLADSNVHFTQASLDAFYLQLTGGTLTGLLTLASNTNSNQLKIERADAGATAGATWWGSGVQVGEVATAAGRFHITADTGEMRFLAQTGFGFNWRVNNITAATLDATALTTEVPILAPVGSAAAPSIRFTDSGTGFYRSTTNEISAAVSGSQQFRIYATGARLISGAFRMPVGSLATPALNFGDPASGFYRGATHQIGLGLNGVLNFYWSAAVNRSFSPMEGLWTDFGTQNTDSSFQKLTQAQYDGITPDANTIYFIVG